MIDIFENYYNKLEKQSLNESVCAEELPVKNITEAINDKIEVIDILNARQGREYYDLSVKLAVSGKAKQLMIDYINNNILSDDESPCTDIKYIVWNKHISEEMSSYYPDYILCDSNDGEFDISHDYYDIEEICKVAGFDKYDVDDAIDKARNYFDFA